MKLSENVEIEKNEFKASNSRASRLARYSTAAAGVAAVSTLDVDAAMIKVIVTDPSAVGTSDYTLDLGEIVSGAKLDLSMSSSSLYISTYGNESVVVTDGLGSNYLRVYDNGDNIVGKLGKSWSWNSGYGYYSMSSSGIFGFRLDQGSSNYTYGWLKATFVSTSSFTLNSYGYNSTLNEAAIAGQGSSAVPDSGPGVVGLALLGAGAAGVRLLRKLRAGK